MKNGLNVEFLSYDRILETIQELCKQEQSLLQIAVSYWGQGALSDSGILDRVKKDANSVKVICDLDSPGCNPEPIQQLVTAGASVKTLNKFHAKVWICGDNVIVGSANVSFYGLGFYTTEERQRNVEAAVLIRSSELAKDAQIWFQTQWNNSVSVDANLVKSALVSWRDRSIVIENSPLFRPTVEPKKEFGNKLPFQLKARYREFFKALLESLRKHEFPLGKKLTAQPANRLVFGAGHTRVYYFARFTKDKKESMYRAVYRHS